MKEKFVSIFSGAVLGLIGTITMERVVDVIIMSFIGGVAGALGHTFFKWIKKKI